MGKHILNIKNVSFEYQGKPVLEKINFSMGDKDLVAVIGPNGGGKTTLVKLIMGLIPPHKGKISLFNASPEKGRQHVGYLAQFRQVDMNYPITVIDTVLMSRLVAGPFYRYSRNDHQRALEALDRVGISNLAHRSLSELSGGQKQRVFLARAIINTPKLLILDEPTTSIDSPSETDFYEMIRNLNDHMAILMISHDLSAVSKTVDKIACLNKTLIYHGTKELHRHDLESTYGCAVDLIAHGIPHRVLDKHG
jgi:zinc transport system ATP-binding protein